MTQGISGSYAVNGVNLFLQPSEGRWAERESFGISGNGPIIYSAVRQFEMFFQLSSMNDYNQFLNLYNSVSGTAIVDLPKYNANNYTFYSYSGCCIQEPVMGVFFNKYPTEVKWTIYGIKT